MHAGVTRGEDYQEPLALLGEKVEDGSVAAAAGALVPVSSKPYEARFYILKSFNHENIAKSIEDGVWATQAHNEDKLNDSYYTSDNVRPAPAKVAARAAIVLPPAHQLPHTPLTGVPIGLAPLPRPSISLPSPPAPPLPSPSLPLSAHLRCTSFSA